MEWSRQEERATGTGFSTRSQRRRLLGTGKGAPANAKTRTSLDPGILPGRERVDWPTTIAIRPRSVVRCCGCGGRRQAVSGGIVDEWMDIASKQSEPRATGRPLSLPELDIVLRRSRSGQKIEKNRDRREEEEERRANDIAWVRPIWPWNSGLGPQC